MRVLALILAFAGLLVNLTLFINLKPPGSFYFVMFQLAATALAPVLTGLGVLSVVLGVLSRARAAWSAGAVSAVISIVYMLMVTSSHNGFADAFGADWESKIAPSQAEHMLRGRWRPGLPQTREPVFEQDVVFWTIPGTERELLCDVWQPAEGVARSGLAVVYLHGSAWYMFDKDLGTRPMFQRLTDQGHVVMDVAYRLTPEVDIYGMVGDVKRAVAWMRDNADAYGVDPQRIVLAGGSAGGHLALLAAYTPDEVRLMPDELAGKDLSVHAVVSFYGPTDMRATYAHLAQERLIGMPKVDIGQPGAATMEKEFGDAGRMDMLLGGHLHEVPEIYDLASPLVHAGADSPPTLLIQGKPDIIAPYAATREMTEKLRANGVRVVNIVYPLTNHAFDLLLPEVSPAAQAALYELERFLAVVQ